MKFFQNTINMKHQPLTAHHRLPESFWWKWVPDNIVMLRENVHRAVHTVYQDDTPIKRIRRRLEEDKDVFLPEVYNVLNDVLTRFERRETEVYKRHTFDIDTFIKRLKRNGQIYM